MKTNGIPCCGTKITGIFPVIIGLLLLLSLAGCNRSLESLPVLVERSDGSGFSEVKTIDLGRRSPEDEAYVVPLTSNRARPFRYRIEATSASPFQLERASARVTVTLSGDISGGEFTVYSGDEGVRFPFSRNVTDRRSLPADSYRLSFPLGSLITDPWEIEFSAPSGSEGYRVEELRFGRGVTEMTFEEAGRLVGVDALLPVVLEEHTVTLPSLEAVIRDHTQALVLEYHARDELFGDRTNRPAVSLVLATPDGRERRLEARLRPGARVLPIRPGLWLHGAATLTIQGLEGFSLRRIAPRVIPRDPLEPVLIELEELQGWPRELWRREEFELFAWSAYPQILWMDHRDYGMQSRMFTRLAFFVEKRGFQGRLLTDEQLEGRHGWNAHNYRPEGLAEFFNTAEATGFQLSGEERTLLEIIVARGLLIENGSALAGERWLPGTGGILSISQDSFPALRRLLTVHEAMHGVFYEEPAFRRMAFDHWDGLSQREREFWQFFFSWMSYDPDDRYLMVNEFQAYILQQGESNANWYFGTRTADRLKVSQPHRAESINLMLRDYPDTFIRAAAVLNASLFQESGMVGGDPFDLRPLD